MGFYGWLQSYPLRRNLVLEIRLNVGVVGEREEKVLEEEGRFCTNGVRSICTCAIYSDSFTYISLFTSKGVPMLVSKSI